MMVTLGSTVQSSQASEAEASPWALTLSIVSLLLLLSACSMVSMAYVNFSFSGCWRYFLSLRISLAFFAFSTSRESMGTQPIPFIQLVKSDLYRFFIRKKENFISESRPWVSLATRLSVKKRRVVPRRERMPSVVTFF